MVGLFAVAIVLVLFAPASALASPVNDEFASASKLFGANLEVTASNLGATEQAGEPSHAGNPGGHSVWYRWVAPAAGAYRIDTCGSSFDTTLAVYSGEAVDALTSLGANDDSTECGAQSIVVFTATQSAVYRIAVDGKGGAAGAISLALHGRPSNDDFASPTLFSSDEASSSTTNYLATAEPGEPEHGGSPAAHSVWYRWVVPDGGLATVNTCGSDFDTTISVYTGTSLSGLTQIASNDDGTGCGPQSETSFQAQSGQLVWVAVDGKGGAVGHLKIEILSAPENDDLAHAAEVSENGVLVHGHNIRATAEPQEPAHAGQSAEHSVWYRLKGHTGAEAATVETCASDFDTVLQVYEFKPPSSEEKPTFAKLTPLGELPEGEANDDYSSCGTKSAIHFGAGVEGATYYIAVDGKERVTGRIGLRVWAGGPNYSSDRAIALAAAQTATGYYAGGDAWYKWTAQFSGSATVDTCGSSFDTVLSVYTEPMATPLAANDDASGCPPQSRLTFAATAGSTYWFTVGGKAGEEGEYHLRLEEPPPPPPQPPPNDDFLAPEALAGQTAESGNSDTTVAATREAGEPTHAGNLGAGSVWYSWTAPAAGTLALDTCKAGFDTLLAVYRGSGLNELTTAAEDDDSTVCGPAYRPSGTGSSVSLAASAGTTYRIAVDGYDGARGGVGLYLHFRPDDAPRESGPLPPPPIITPPIMAEPACHKGSVRKNGKCVKRLPSCPKGKVRRGTKCFVKPSGNCPHGRVYRHGRCVKRNGGHRRRPVPRRRQIATEATGNTYYAESGAKGSTCSQAAPCSVFTAVSKAGDGDSVVLAAGPFDDPYDLSTVGLRIEDEIDFGAAPGALAVLTTGPGGSVDVDGKSGATIHDLKIEGKGGLELESGSADRVFVADERVGEDACAIAGGAEMRDSVCWATETAGGSDAIEVADGGSENQNDPVLMRNVTAIATDATGSALRVTAGPGALLEVDAAGVIARSANAVDIVAEADPSVGSEAHLNIADSDFGESLGESGSKTRVTALGVAGNISAPPSFLALTTGDFHVGAGSPTIDTGIDDASVGTLDLDGNPRHQAGCVGSPAIPDMGAYERAPTVACVPTQPPSPPPAPRKPIFRIVSLKLNKTKGEGRLLVEAPGAGTVSLTGSGVKLVRRTAPSEGGVVSLPVQAWAITKVRLSKRGKTRVRLVVTFKGRGGEFNEWERPVVLRKAVKVEPKQRQH